MRLPSAMPGEPSAAVAHAIASTPMLAPWLASRPPGTLWVGFSGGRDSTVLLHALRDIPRAVATHVDHGLHADSSAWARHCARIAAELAIRLETRRACVAPRGNRAQEARRARYAVWGRLLRPGDVLALAHHANDQAETRLWQLMTGREPGGMPAERGIGHGHLVRPLLGVPRSTIARYAEHHRLRWIEDPSNADVSNDRAYIRQRIVPRIEERFPDAVRHLARPRRRATVPGPLPARASGAQIEEWLREAGLPVARKAVAEISRQSNARRDRTPQVRLAPGIHAWRHAGHWHLVRDRAPLGTHAVAVGCDAVTAPGMLGWQRCGTGLPAGVPITMCARVGGERILVDGRHVTKSVKALLREAGVPTWRRPSWPLLTAGGRLLAVPGLAVAADATVADGWLPHWTPAPDF